MRYKSIKTLTALTLSAALILSACKDKEPPTPEPEPIVDQQVTVQNLKEKYKYQDNQIAPLYNVEKNEEFRISFNSYLGDLAPSEVITVHTSIDGEIDSLIDTELTPETYQVGPSTFTLTSTEQVLSRTQTKGYWGDAETYYIKINYDLDATTPTRLEQPLMVPFTIKNNLNPAQLTPVITESGKFSLTIDNPHTDNSSEQPTDQNKEKTSYAVFNVSRHNTSTVENYDKSLTELSYISTYTSKLGNVTKPYFSDWKGVTKTGNVDLSTNPSDRINIGVNGAYYVKEQTANKTAPVSNIIEVKEYAHLIPTNLVGTLNGTKHETIRSLPKTVQVQMLDGSVTDATVKYLTDDLKPEPEKPLTIPFEIDNTPYKGTITVKAITTTDLNSLKEGYQPNTVSTLTLPKNSTKKRPSITVSPLIFKTEAKTDKNSPTDQTESGNPSTDETVAPPPEGTKTEDVQSTQNTNQTQPDKTGEQSSTGGAQGFGNIDPNKEGTTPDDLPTTSKTGILNKQYEATELAVSAANNQLITIPSYIQALPTNPLTFTSAVEEFLTYELLANKTLISLNAFPTAQTYQAVTDAIEGVYLQNPLLNPIKEWSYDYEKRVVTVEYENEFNKEDLIKAAQTVLTDLLMEDAVLTEKEIKKGVAPYKVPKDLTQQEKYTLIYQYVVDNITLPAPTLEQGVAKAGEGITQPEQQEQENLPVNNSAHKALTTKQVNDLGFARTLKFLLDLADIDSLVITGTYQGKPHAWNKVNLDGQWYNTDPTLNAIQWGIPNALNLASDETATLLGYHEDKRYYNDLLIPTLSATTNNLEFYSSNSLEVDSLSQYAQVLERQLQAGERVVIIRTLVNLDPQTIYDTTGLVIQQTVPDHLATATFNAKGKYYIVVTHDEEQQQSGVSDGEGVKTETTE